ncbi:hypothetical protein BAE44_0018868 [Dichanthelium oligosanthes]|uniref:RRM domain-containing protein n=1 Tax=Dichanthelium oligosanthes TaxID=888268 RepID=A0A1E5V4M8_9POAL|nr:hypothetical protein BAE44_0018868 [Dichanthelium oligosanthes]
MLATTDAGESQWSELPPDLLRDISGRLHATVDFVRFHAVCRPWREALDRSPHFLPWLLAPSDAHVASVDLADQRWRCVFSKTSYRAPGLCIRDRRVACADGTAAWLVGGNYDPGLVNPLTAAHLPSPLRYTGCRMPDHTHRVVSGDDTILVYHFTPHPPGEVAYYRGDDFKGAILCPENDCPYHKPWMNVSADLATHHCCAAVYNRGDVVCSHLASCYILWQDVHWYTGHYPTTRTTQAALPDEPGKIRRCSYLLESRGGDEHELLLASILQEASCCTAGDRLACDNLSVSLHALVRERDGDKPLVEWARRDYDLLSGDVLFLGFPGSFTVDASRFGGEVSGDTAYFVRDKGSGGQTESCRVYRYSFHDGSATLVETLPPGWHDARCMWFLPQPEISLIRGRRTLNRQGGPATSSGSSGGKELKIYVGDLSPKVDNSRLRGMFSKHGKVACAKVAYDKKGRFRGFGFVTMVTQQGFDNAMAALNAGKEMQTAA